MHTQVNSMNVVLMLNYLVMPMTYILKYIILYFTNMIAASVR